MLFFINEIFFKGKTMHAPRFNEGSNTSALLMILAEQELSQEALSDGILLDIELNAEYENVMALSPDNDQHHQEEEESCDDYYYYTIDTTPTPTEDLWEGETSGVMPETGGVELLRWLMEGVKASEIKNKSAVWVATKYCGFSAMIVGALLDKSVCKDPSQIIGRYSVAMEHRLREFGIEFKIFGGITELGYQRLNEIMKQETETV